MKKLLIILAFFSINLFAQVEYVLTDNPVYDFLERMETRQIIHNYNTFDLPKTRKEIASLIKQVIESQNQLDESDLGTLEDLKTEFEYELFGTTKNSQSLFDEGNANFISQKQKYLYFIADSANDVNLYLNTFGKAEEIFKNNILNSANVSTAVLSLGFDFRVNFFDHFGFDFRGLNAIVTGNRQTALLRNDVVNSYRFNSPGEQTSFDETQAGYFVIDYDNVKFKFGRDRVKLGYGPIKSIIDENSERFDHIYLKLKYKSMEITYFHGKLLGNTSVIPDSIHGELNAAGDKYIGYHRLGFNISEDFSFGGSEIIIYSDRNLDFTYLNPFNLYKFAQNSNRDRDNSMIAFDVNNKSIKGLKLYAMFLMDDIELDKLGTGFWGNQFIYNFGFYSSNLYKILPIDIQFEYTRMDPFVFTHRIQRNNFTQVGRSLGSFLQPNSELFFTQLNYRITNRLSIKTSFSYSVHGANILNPDGSVKVNAGGDINFGHRTTDPFTAHFLDGFREYKREYSATILYEPYNEVFARLTINYLSETKQFEPVKKELQTFFAIFFQL